MKSAQKTIALWFALAILAVFLFQAYSSHHDRVVANFNYAKFSESVKNKEITNVVFRPETGEITGDIKPEFEKKYDGGKHFSITGNTGDEGFKF